VTSNQDLKVIILLNVKKLENSSLQDGAIFIMANQQKFVYGLSNGAIFNDLEQTLTQFLRSRYSLTLNIL